MGLLHAGARVDSIDHWAARVRELEAAIAAARAHALAAPLSAAFFAFFTSQKAAAIAAQANLHPEDGHSFRVVEAPGPEEARSSFLHPGSLRQLLDVLRAAHYS